MICLVIWTLRSEKLLTKRKNGSTSGIFMISQAVSLWWRPICSTLGAMVSRLCEFVGTRKGYWWLGCSSICRDTRITSKPVSFCMSWTTIKNKLHVMSTTLEAEILAERLVAHLDLLFLIRWPVHVLGKYKTLTVGVFRVVDITTFCNMDRNTSNRRTSSQMEKSMKNLASSLVLHQTPFKGSCLRPLVTSIWITNSRSMSLSFP